MEASDREPCAQDPREQTLAPIQVAIGKSLPRECLAQDTG